MDKLFMRTPLSLIWGIFFICFVVLVPVAQADVLSPGNISTCGDLTTSGTYTLTGNVTGDANTCFNVTADNVTINGGGFTVTGSGPYAINATSSAPTLNAYTGLTVQNITFSGYTDGIKISGNNGTTFAGGHGGSVTIQSSTLGTILAYGGNAAPAGIAGHGGAVSVTSSTVGNISNYGGLATNGGGAAGGSVTISGSTSGSISNYGGNSTVDAGANGGSVDITSSSSVGNITSNGGNSTDNSGGNGGSISIANSDFGNIASNGGTGTSAGSGGSVAINKASIIFTGKTLSSSGSTNGTLTLTYTGCFADPSSHSAFADVTINGNSNGSVLSGTLLSSLIAGWSACTVPTVTTSAASAVAATSATLNGNITNLGGDSGGTQKGFAYGTASNLSGGNTATTTGGSFSGTGSFTGAVSSLSCGTAYYSRAYATNAIGTAYGSIITFTPACASVSYSYKNPYPTLREINPNFALKNSGDLEVTLLGDDFLGTSLISDSIVYFDGKAVKTIPYSPTKIFAVIPEEYLSEERTVEVYILNPTPGGGSSDSIQFKILPDKLLLPPQASSQAEESVPVISELPESAQENIISAIFTKGLDRGMRDPDVERLQKLFSADKEIYPEGFVTGYFGPFTEAAVRRFQVRHGIDNVGRVGPITRAKLKEVFGSGR